MNDKCIMDIANSLSNNDLEHLLTYVSDRLYVWHKVDGQSTLSRVSYAHLNGALLTLNLENEE